MLQTPENSSFNKNRSRKLSGNNLTGGKNQGEYNTTAEPKQKPSTLLRPGKAGNLSVSKRITSLFTGKVKFRSHILHFEIKETTFEFGYFTAISGVFFANHIDIFHKPLVLMVILRC